MSKRWLRSATVVLANADNRKGVVLRQDIAGNAAPILRRIEVVVIILAETRETQDIAGNAAHILRRLEVIVIILAETRETKLDAAVFFRKHW
jgi:hypothetical protein